jgi:hypothetical protein
MNCVPQTALLVLFQTALVTWGCSGSNDSEKGDSAQNTISNTDTDIDTDTDTDIDTNTNTNTNTDTDTTDSDSRNGELGNRNPPWADIIEVEMSGSVNSYQVMATFHSTDIDCTEYANWIEVLTENGELVYRRILIHPHTPPLSGNPVARGGGPVNVSADDVVIVRAHMNTVGYQGLAMRGSVNTGFESAPDITANFAADVESLDPQPDGCTPEEDIMPGK